MAAVLRNSTLYDSRDVSKYIQDRRDIGGPGCGPLWNSPIR